MLALAHLLTCEHNIIYIVHVLYRCYITSFQDLKEKKRRLHNSFGDAAQSKRKKERERERRKKAGYSLQTLYLFEFFDLHKNWNIKWVYKKIKKKNKRFSKRGKNICMRTMQILSRLRRRRNTQNNWKWGKNLKKRKKKFR